MKTLNYYIALAAALFVLQACESNLEKVTFDSSLATPAKLHALDESYTLDSKKPDETAFTLTWDTPDMNYTHDGGAAVTNNIEMDLNGKDFSHPRVLAAVSASDTEQAFTNNELNSAILALLKDGYGMDTEDEANLGARKFDIRIRSSISDAGKPVYSNTITTTLTPYSMEVSYPEVYLVGDYSAWKWEQAQSLFSFHEDKNYTGVVDFAGKAANGFKLTGTKDWNNGNWGTSGSSPDSEAAQVQLIDDGASGNISCYSKRFYRFQFNTSTSLLKKEFGFDVLSVNGDALQASAGAEATDVDMQFDPVKQRFYADVTLQDGKIKFRADHNSNLVFGAADKEGMLQTDGGDIAVKAGSYRVYVNLNNPSEQTYVLNTTDFGK